MAAQELKDVKIRMKPPLSYYGGKQKLSRDICRALYQSPNWDVKGHYIEPYFGGGAVFFAKEPQKMETINDLNDNLIAFYRVVKDPQGFEKLKALLDGTLYSRSEFYRAGRILRGQEEADDITRAWAAFVQSAQGFGHKWGRGWGYCIDAEVGTAHPAQFERKINSLAEGVKLRLRNAYIESRDALGVIKSRDSRSSLFYIDPPYPNTWCGYEHDYSDADLAALLETLKTTKGRFVLSGFPHPLIDEAQAECGWFQLRKRCAYSMQVKDPAKKAGKIECLIANYPFYLEGWEIVGQCAERPLPQEARVGKPQLELLEGSAVGGQAYVGY